MTDHAVRALLSDGWTAQACPDAASAAALFDRLRAYPVQLERLAGGRVIEATFAPFLPAPLTAAEG